MTRYLVDTDILSQHREGVTAIVARVGASLERNEVAISVISVEELISGWYGLLRKSDDRGKLAYAYRRLTQSLQVIKIFPIITFSERAIATFEDLKRRKLNVGSMDLRIASIALELNLTVVTRNLRDFLRVPGLSVEDWSS